MYEQVPTSKVQEPKIIAIGKEDQKTKESS